MTTTYHQASRKDDGRTMAAPMKPLLFDTEGCPVFLCQEANGRFVFTCPQCGKRNAHGAIAGHRAAHCDCWPQGYRVEPEGGA